MVNAKRFHDTVTIQHISSTTALGQKEIFDLTLLSTTGKTFTFTLHSSCLNWLSMRYAREMSFDPKVKLLHELLRVNRFINTMQSRLDRLNDDLLELQELEHASQKWRVLAGHHTKIRLALNRLKMYHILSKYSRFIQDNIYITLLNAVVIPIGVRTERNSERQQAVELLLVQVKETKQFLTINLRDALEIS